MNILVDRLKCVIFGVGDEFLERLVFRIYCRRIFGIGEELGYLCFGSLVDWLNCVIFGIGEEFFWSVWCLGYNAWRLALGCCLFSTL